MRCGFRRHLERSGGGALTMRRLDIEGTSGEGIGGESGIFGASAGGMGSSPRRSPGSGAERGDMHRPRRHAMLPGMWLEAGRTHACAWGRCGTETALRVPPRFVLRLRCSREVPGRRQESADRRVRPQAHPLACRSGKGGAEPCTVARLLREPSVRRRSWTARARLYGPRIPLKIFSKGSLEIFVLSGRPENGSDFGAGRFPAVPRRPPGRLDGRPERGGATGTRSAGLPGYPVGGSAPLPKSDDFSKVSRDMTDFGSLLCPRKRRKY